MAGPFKRFLFPNLVTSLADESGKGESGLRSNTRVQTVAYRLTEGDEIEEVNPKKLRPGDRVVVKAGQIVPGEVEQGIASIDESAITGESAPVAERYRVKAPSSNSVAQTVRRSKVKDARTLAVLESAKS
jgi:P-type E1-E2 ATPase